MIKILSQSLLPRMNLKPTGVDDTSFKGPIFKKESINKQLLASILTVNQIKENLVDCPIKSLFWTTHTSPFTTSGESINRGYIIITVKV